MLFNQEHDKTIVAIYIFDVGFPPKVNTINKMAARAECTFPRRLRSYEDMVGKTTISLRPRWWFSRSQIFRGWTMHKTYAFLNCFHVLHHNGTRSYLIIPTIFTEQRLSRIPSARTQLLDTIVHTEREEVDDCFTVYGKNRGIRASFLALASDSSHAIGWFFCKVFCN